MSYVLHILLTSILYTVHSVNTSYLLQILLTPTLHTQILLTSVLSTAFYKQVLCTARSVNI